MSYTPRFGAITANGILKNNDDTRWLIVAYRDGDPTDISFIDNFGNTLHGTPEFLPDGGAKFIPISMHKRNGTLSENFTDIPLSDDLIMQTIRLFKNKFGQILTFGQQSNIIHASHYDYHDQFKLIKILAPNHYKQHLEMKTIKSRLDVLEQKNPSSMTWLERKMAVGQPPATTQNYSRIYDLQEENRALKSRLTALEQKLSTPQTQSPSAIFNSAQMLQQQINALKAENELTKGQLWALEQKLSVATPTEDLLQLESPKNPFDDLENTIIPPQETDPRKLGFNLEELIHNSIGALDPTYIVRREQDIRNIFKDQSLNGVDHWISKNGNHYMIQTKWRETTTQPEVTQFLTCVDRIQARFKDNEKVKLVWACKTPPTKHALITLTERNVRIISCDLSIQALARNVVDYIASLSFADPTPAYKVLQLPAVTANETQPPTFRVSPTPEVMTPTKVAKVEFDGTDEGKALRQAMETLMNDRLIGHVRRLIYNSQYNSLHSNTVIVDTMFPKTLAEWSNGSHKKINYNKLLKQLKDMNYPSSKNPVQLMFFSMYCKMRYVSTILSQIALEYNAKRSELLAKKSAWAKSIPELVCVAEPMTTEEYKSIIVHTREYTQEKEAYISRMLYNCTGSISDSRLTLNKTYKSHYDNQFWMHYQIT